MKIEVAYKDIFENCETEEQAWDALLEYLRDVVRYEDLTGFSFKEIKE